MAGALGLFTKEMLEKLAKKSGDTQVATTGGSYKKAGDILEREGIFGNVLDYGAGRGHGTQYLPGSAKSYEPNPMEGYTPDFTESPDEMFDGIANLNVLNVVPEPIRQEIATDIYNILGSRDDVQIRHADKAAFDPEYNGPNILGGAALPITAGLLAGGQSDDADAGIIRQGVPDVLRLLQSGMLQTDTDRATKAALKKYDNLLATNPAFAHREELAGDNLFQTVREQSEFDLGQDGYLTMDDLRDYTIVPVRSDRSMIGTIDQVGGIEIPRETVQGGFQFPM